MSGQLGLLAGVPTQAEHHAELRSRGDDPTPRPAVEAILTAAMPYLLRAGWWGKVVAGRRDFGGEKPLRVLDVCAGYGCWASVMRMLAARQGWPVHITGVELDGRKREHLEKWCDEVYVDDWRDQVVEPLQGESSDFDLVIGNPDFAQLLSDALDWSMPATLLERAPVVILLHTQQAFLRGREGRAVWRRYPAFRQWMPPPIGFRGDGKTDARCYVASMWVRGHTGPTIVDMLGEPPNGAGAYHWTKLPGTESPEDADALGLPLAPGYTTSERARPQRSPDDCGAKKVDGG